MTGPGDYDREAAAARRSLRGLHHAGGMLGGDARAAVVEMQEKLADGSNRASPDAREAALEAAARRWLVRGVWAVAAVVVLVVLIAGF